MKRKLVLTISMVFITTLLVSFSSGLKYCSACENKIIVKSKIDFGFNMPNATTKFKDNLILGVNVKEEGYYLNTDGEITFKVPDKYDFYGGFSDGLLLVKDKETNLYGYLDQEGNLKIPCKFRFAEAFNEGVALVTLVDGTQACIYKDGNIIGKLNFSDSKAEGPQLPFFSDGLIMVYDKNDKFGYMNTKGELVIEPIYTSGGEFRCGMALVRNDEGLEGYIDIKGRNVVPFKYKDLGYFCEGLATVKDENGKFGYINKKGELVIPCNFDYAGNFSEGLALIKNKEGKIAYIDKTGNIIIPFCKYNCGRDFSNGLALVGIEDENNEYQFGYIDKKGNLLTELKYHWSSGDFSENHAIGIVNFDNNKAELLEYK